MRLGMLTPSSNTVLEPVTAEILADRAGVTAHFSRLRVLQISLDGGSQAQFSHEPMLKAAELLADARVDSICWNGTSSGWLGFEQDRLLCEAIRAHTGIPACSAVLGMNRLLERAGVRRLALVTPYIEDVQRRIIANYEADGIACVADRRLGISDNFAFGEVSAATIRQMCLDVSLHGPDAILIYCTNLAGAGIVRGIEAETGVPVIDSAAAAVWMAMAAAGREAPGLAKWGCLLD